MPETTCSEKGCTIAETGICARTGAPEPCELATVPHSIEEEIAEVLTPTEIVSTTAPSTPVSEWIGPHPGLELGLEDISELMDQHGSRLIGILGAHATGKTMFLISFYLLCACGGAGDHGYAFAGSMTLPGLKSALGKAGSGSPGKFEKGCRFIPS